MSIHVYTDYSCSGNLAVVHTVCNVFTLNPKNSPKYPFFGQFSVLNHASKSFNLKNKESKPISQCPKFIQVQHHANLNRKALHFQSSDNTFGPPRYHQLWLLGPTWASCAPAGTLSHTQPIRKTSAIHVVFFHPACHSPNMS